MPLIAVAPRFNPVTAALVKEARERLASLRVASSDFERQVHEARKQLNEAHRQLRLIEGKPEPAAYRCVLASPGGTTSN